MLLKLVVYPRYLKINSILGHIAIQVTGLPMFAKLFFLILKTVLVDDLEF